MLTPNVGLVFFQALMLLNVQQPLEVLLTLLNTNDEFKCYKKSRRDRKSRRHDRPAKIASSQCKNVHKRTRAQHTCHRARCEAEDRGETGQKGGRSPGRG